MRLKHPAVVLACAAALAAAAWAGAAQGENAKRQARLEGAQEVPGPGDPDGRGRAALRLDAAGGEVCFTLSWRDIAAPHAAHVHQGGAGAAGPIVATLFSGQLPGTITGVRGCTAADPELVQDIKDHPADYYVNVHNGEFPDGALRGQLQGKGSKG